MKTARQILEEKVVQARKGSCKECAWCEFIPVWDGYCCAIQGNWNSIFFSTEDLDRKPYPWVCEEGAVTNEEICAAFTSKGDYSPQDTYSEHDHRDFMHFLYRACELEKDIAQGTLNTLLTKLNALLTKLNTKRN